MLVTGEAKFMGVRSGSKEGRRWANVYLDAHDNLLERLQVFASDDLIDAVLMLVPGTDVSLEARLYSNQKGDTGVRLQSIRVMEKTDKAGK